MINTGQVNALPWERPSPPSTLLKTQAFYSTRGNLWENQYLTSRKVASYYHTPNNLYALSNPSDTEKNLQAQNEQDTAKRTEQLILRHNQRTVLKNRKIERELLQCVSSQGVTENADLGLVQGVYESPTLATECKLRKSLTFKDPTKISPMHSTARYSYNNMTPKQLRVLLRPKVLKEDQNACKYIAARFQLEKEAQDLRSTWQQVARIDRLNSLSKRHLNICQLELRCGVPKHRHSSSSDIASPIYTPNEHSQMFQTRFSNFKGINRSSAESPLVARLKGPKTEYCSPRAFAHSDFRGLVHADGLEALEQVSRPQHRTPQRLPSCITQNTEPTMHTGRSSSTGMRSLKQTATNLQFPRPLNSGLISPLPWRRKEYLEKTLSANFSSWGNLCKSPQPRLSCKEEIAQKVKQDQELREIEKDAKYYKELLKNHEVKFGSAGRTKVGYSRMMLKEATNSERIELYHGEHKEGQ